LLNDLKNAEIRNLRTGLYEKAEFRKAEDWVLNTAYTQRRLVCQIAMEAGLMGMAVRAEDWAIVPIPAKQTLLREAAGIIRTAVLPII